MIPVQCDFVVVVDPASFPVLRHWLWVKPPNPQLQVVLRVSRKIQDVLDVWCIDLLKFVVNCRLKNDEIVETLWTKFLSRGVLRWTAIPLSLLAEALGDYSA